MLERVGPFTAPGIAATVLTLRGREDEIDAVLSAIDERAGVLIAGPRSTGRTRLVDEAVRRCESRGDPVHTFEPSEEMRWSSVDAGQTTVVVADDADQLDSAEQHQLIQLLGRPDVVGVVTLRVDVRAQLRQAVRPWLATGMIGVVAGPLADDDQWAVAHELLGGQADTASAHPLIELAGGRPGDLVELVLGSLETGALRYEDERWRLVGPPSLHRVRSDLDGSLDAETVSEAATLLALVGHVPKRLLTATLGTARTRQLISTGIAIEKQEPGGDVISFARPVEGALLREACTDAKRETLLTMIADRADATGWTAEVAGRVAQWRLATGGGTAELFLAVAADAYRKDDMDLAEMCATAAIDRGASDEGHYRRATVRARRGDLAGAADDLRRTTVQTDEIDALSAMHRAHAGEPVPAGGVARGAEAAYRAFAAALDGHHDEAARFAAQVDSASPGAGTDVVTDEFRTAAETLVAVARLDAARVTELRARFRFDDHAATVAPVVRTILASGPFQIDTSSGADLRMTRRHVEDRRAAAERSGDRTATLEWLVATAKVRLARGDVAGALRASRRLVEMTDAGEVQLAAGSWSAIHASNLVHAGQLAAATEFLERARTGAVDRDPSPFHQLVSLQLEGSFGPGHVVHDVVTLIDRAVAAGDVRTGIEAAATALRLGGAGQRLRDTCRQLAEGHPCPRTDLLAQHANASTDGGMVEFEALAQRYLGHGRNLDAAGALVQAAQFADTAGRQRILSRAAGVLATCPDAWTPGIDGLDSISLTQQERITGMDAVAGEQNAAIARRQNVSVRTVENRLSRLYRRLGVSGRLELARWHGDLFEGP